MSAKRRLAASSSEVMDWKKEVIVLSECVIRKLARGIFRFGSRKRSKKSSLLSSGGQPATGGSYSFLNLGLQASSRAQRNRGALSSRHGPWVEHFPSRSVPLIRGKVSCRIRRRRGPMTICLEKRGQQVPALAQVEKNPSRQICRAMPLQAVIGLRDPSGALLGESDLWCHGRCLLQVARAFAGGYWQD